MTARRPLTELTAIYDTACEIQSGALRGTELNGGTTDSLARSYAMAILAIGRDPKLNDPHFPVKVAKLLMAARPKPVDIKQGSL